MSLGQGHTKWPTLQEVLQDELMLLDPGPGVWTGGYPASQVQAEFGPIRMPHPSGRPRCRWPEGEQDSCQNLSFS